jgi:hypothetical protein
MSVSTRLEVSAGTYRLRRDLEDGTWPLLLIMLAAFRPYKANVGGSSPSAPTKINNLTAKVPTAHLNTVYARVARLLLQH